MEDAVVEPGDVDTTAVDVSDTFVSTPDVEVVVVDTNGDLASALALTLSASELSENSWKFCDAINDESWMGLAMNFVEYLFKLFSLELFFSFTHFYLFIAVGCCGY